MPCMPRRGGPEIVCHRNVLSAGVKEVNKRVDSHSDGIMYILSPRIEERNDQNAHLGKCRGSVKGGMDDNLQEKKKI